MRSPKSVLPHLSGFNPLPSQEGGETHDKKIKTGNRYQFQSTPQPRRWGDSPLHKDIILI